MHFIHSHSSVSFSNSHAHVSKCIEEISPFSSCAVHLFHLHAFSKNIFERLDYMQGLFFHVFFFLNKKQETSTSSRV